jgi:hypothetical protein
LPSTEKREFDNASGPTGVFLKPCETLPLRLFINGRNLTNAEILEHDSFL